MKKLFLAAVVGTFVVVGGASTAHAEDAITGCQHDVLLGLDPKIRKVCDGAIGADGIWVRTRQFVTTTKVRSTCGGRIWYDYDTGCPPWLERDRIPGYFGMWEYYEVSNETIPPGEPGHLDNPVRCQTQTYRCDVP